MEPETSAPKLGPEQAPIEYGPSIEQAQQASPERGLLETGNEHKEQVAEGAARTTDLAGPSVVLPMPVVTPSDDTATDDQTAVSASPAVAADEDLIEKEWVDRAKKIVADTREDPYTQENAVSQLQKDYLKKRYGRELGEAN